MNAGLRTLLLSVGGSFLAAKLLTKQTAPAGIGTSNSSYSAPADPNTTLLQTILKKLTGTPTNGTSPTSSPTAPKSGGTGSGVGSGPSFGGGGAGSGGSAKPPAPGDVGFLFDPNAWQVNQDGFAGPSSYGFYPEDPGLAVDPSTIDMSWANDGSGYSWDGSGGDLASDSTLNDILGGLQIDPPAAYDGGGSYTDYADWYYSDPYADDSGGGYPGVDVNSQYYDNDFNYGGYY